MQDPTVQTDTFSITFIYGLQDSKLLGLILYSILYFESPFYPNIYKEKRKEIYTKSNQI